MADKIKSRYMIEIVTESEYNMTQTFEWMCKEIQSKGNTGYLKNGVRLNSVKEIRMWKVLPERTHIKDGQPVKRHRND